MRRDPRTFQMKFLYFSPGDNELKLASGMVWEARSEYGKKEGRSDSVIYARTHAPSCSDFSAKFNQRLPIDWV